MARPDLSYHELADELAELIRHMAPGDRLASENDLVAEYGVSRISARSALQELERRMLVRRTRGSGTRVALRLPYPLRAGMTPSWGQLVRAAGHVPSYAVDDVENERAGATIARALLLPRGRTVTRIRRRMFVDGEVTTVQTHWLPVDRFPDLAERHPANASLSRTLHDEYGIELDRMWSRATLDVPAPDVARTLELTGRPPTWRIESTNRCIRLGVPVEYAVAWDRADAFDVMLEVGPFDTGPEPR